MALQIVPVPVLNDNYVWLIHDAASGETAAVDPSVGPPVLEAAEGRGWQLTQVLNTHWHPDHTGGNQAIHDAGQRVRLAELHPEQFGHQVELADRDQTPVQRAHDHQDQREYV